MSATVTIAGWVKKIEKFESATAIDIAVRVRGKDKAGEFHNLTNYYRCLCVGSHKTFADKLTDDTPVIVTGGLVANGYLKKSGEAGASLQVFAYSIAYSPRHDSQKGDAPERKRKHTVADDDAPF
jgi:hypothetical protein